MIIDFSLGQIALDGYDLYYEGEFVIDNFPLKIDCGQDENSDTMFININIEEEGFGYVSPSGEDMEEYCSKISKILEEVGCKENNGGFLGDGYIINVVPLDYNEILNFFEMLEQVIRERWY